MKTITVKTYMFLFKKRLMPRFEWILPDNKTSLALESNPMQLIVSFLD